MAADYTERSLDPSSESYFLLGPRGTGKSTWLMKHYPRATRIDLLLGEEERRYSAFPERIRMWPSRWNQGKLSFSTKFERAPNLLPEIHALIEKKRGIQIIMTGSSARKLRRTVSDLLGGRALSPSDGPLFSLRVKGTVFS